MKKTAEAVFIFVLFFPQLKLWAKSSLNKELNQVIFILMKKNKLKIYSDVDGTITEKDVWMQIGDFFIKDRAGWEELIRKFESLEIGARECFTREVQLIENFDIKKFNEVIDEQRIDDSFLYFYKYYSHFSRRELII